MAATIITQNSLKEILSYDPETGIFTNKNTRGRAKENAIAGCINKKTRYVVLRINYSLYQAHRVAWFYMTGNWPIKQIDHINHNRSDNRWVNLREATNQQNNWNLPAKKTNKSGYRGVHWDNDRRKWRSRIVIDGKCVHIGMFECPKEAHLAYMKVAKKLYGEFCPRLS